jgi:hypothetical protein
MAPALWRLGERLAGQPSRGAQIRVPHGAVALVFVLGAVYAAVAY